MTATKSDRRATGRALWRVAVDESPVALAAGGRLVAVGGAAGTAWVLDAADGHPAATLTLPGGILDLAFSRDGRHLVFTGPQGYGLWHAGDSRATVVSSGRRAARARWADPGMVAVADGRTAVVLDTAGRQLWRTAQAPGTITDLTWLRGGQSGRGAQGGRLAVATEDGVSCHELQQPLPVASLGYPGSHLAIAATRDGRWICTGSEDAFIHVWRTRDDTADFVIRGDRRSAVTRLAFDDTGRWLAADPTPDVAVWDFTGNGPQGQAPQVLRAHDTVTALAWRPGKSTVLATAGAEGVIALWDAAAGRPGRTRITTAGWSLEDDVAALAWNGPGLLVAATLNGTVRALDAAGRG